MKEAVNKKNEKVICRCVYGTNNCSGIDDKGVVAFIQEAVYRFNKEKALEILTKDPLTQSHLLTGKFRIARCPNHGYIVTSTYWSMCILSKNPMRVRGIDSEICGRPIATSDGKLINPYRVRKLLGTPR